MPRIHPVAPLAILSVLILSTFSFAAAPDRISGSINAGQSVRLAGGAPLQARPEFDRGAVDSSQKMTRITLLTKPSPAQQKALTKLLADQQNPRSASYHKWLTPEQYADRFGLSQNDTRKITDWLQSQGFTIVATARGREWIAFNGTAAQVEKTFQPQLHTFQVKGETHFANTMPPHIPAALSGIVAGFRGFNNFRAKAQNHRSKPDYNFAGLLNGHFIAPGDIATMYNLNALYSLGIDGTGQRLAVIGQTDVYQDDLADFRSGFGLSAISCTTSGSGIITSCNTSNFKYVLIAGDVDPGVPDSIGDDLPEADIDLEWSGATARKAQIIYVNAPDFNGNGIYDSMYDAIDNNRAPVMTMSYTFPCELAEADVDLYTTDELEFQKANSFGITFMNSSGDTGAAECDYGNDTAVYGYAVAYPASSAEITGVGGTLIPYNEYTSTYWGNSNGSDGGSAKQYIPEYAWNDSQEWSIYCTAVPSDGTCQANPGLDDWQTAQETYLNIVAGGGGVSNCIVVNGSFVCQSGIPQPSWQAGLDANSVNPGGIGELVSGTPTRYTPDVSLLASIYWPGYIVCTARDELIGGSDTTSTCSPGGSSGIVNNMNYGFVWGGTSISSPIFAGIVSMLNQYLNGNTNAGLGNINPTLYTLAATPLNGAFHPITSGNIGAWCQGGQPSNQPVALQCPSTGPSADFIGFDASNSDPTTGYSLAAGLGSVNASNLFVAWAGGALSATTTTLISSKNPSNYGDSVTFTATVTPTGATTPTGTVTFKDGATTIGTGFLGCLCNGTVGNPATTSFTTSTLSSTGSPHSITAIYGGDSSNAGSSSAALIQVVNPATFTFVSTGAPTHTELAGQSSLVYTFTATPTSGSMFVGALTIDCSFSPTDQTLTSASCGYSVNGGSVQTGPITIPAGTGTSTVTLVVTSQGPNTGTGTQFRHQSDKRLPWVPMTLPLAGIVLAGFAGRKRSKYSVVASLCLALVLAGFLIACGGGGNSTPSIGVSVGSSASSIYPQNTGWTNSTATFTATVSNDASGKGVTWSVSPTLSGQSITATDSTHATYTPPTIAQGLPASVTVTATSVADPSKSGSHPITLTPTTVPVVGGYTVTVTATETGALTSATPSVTLVVN